MTFAGINVTRGAVFAGAPWAYRGWAQGRAAKSVPAAVVGLDAFRARRCDLTGGVIQVARHGQGFRHAQHPGQASAGICLTGRVSDR
jgi:hypothetical protein